MEPTKEDLQEVLEALVDLYQQADEDCPHENRTIAFSLAMEDTREVLIKYGIIKVYEEEDE